MGRLDEGGNGERGERGLRGGLCVSLRKGAQGLGCIVTAQSYMVAQLLYTECKES